jgi:lipid-binding SYLF domain-containing protein
MAIVWKAFPLAVVAAFLVVTAAGAQNRETETVQSALDVFLVARKIPENGLPDFLLNEAKAIAIVPDMVKLGFVVGVRRGHGVLLVRNADGRWSNPVFIVLTGGSLGWQIGVQSVDVVLVFSGNRSLEQVLQGKGKVTLGADAGLAAGPVGRQITASTDIQLQSEIYSYSRSRGLFAGVSIDGAAMEIDSVANAVFYRAPGIAVPNILENANLKTPDVAQRLQDAIAANTLKATSAEQAVASRKNAMSSGNKLPTEGETRQQLAAAALQLDAVLDERWNTYLALPKEVFGGRDRPSPEAIGRAVQRFERVRQSPEYSVVAEKAEFKKVEGLLVQYQGQLRSLPPPKAPTQPVAPMAMPEPPREFPGADR